MWSSRYAMINLRLKVFETNNTGRAKTVLVSFLFLVEENNVFTMFLVLAKANNDILHRENMATLWFSLNDDSFAYLW